MVLAGAVASIAAFLWAMSALRVLQAGLLLVTAAGDGARLLADRTIADHARERDVRRASLRLLIASLAVCLRATLAVLVATVPALIVDVTGLAAATDVVRRAARWDLVALASLAVVGEQAFARARRRA